MTDLDGLSLWLIGELFLPQGFSPSSSSLKWRSYVGGGAWSSVREDGFRGCVVALALDGADVAVAQHVRTAANVRQCDADSHKDYLQQLRKDGEAFDEDSHLERISRTAKKPL